MARIVVVKRVLPPSLSILTRFLTAFIGFLIAVYITSVATGLGFSETLRTAFESFLDLNVFRYISVFLPIALGLAIAFNANLWNLGAEGQLVMGAVGATYIALFTPLGKMDYIAPIASLAFAAIIGLLWALIPSVMRLYLGVNEAVTTLLMNYIAYYFSSYLVKGPWRGRGVYGYTTTDMIPDASKLPVVPGYSFSWYIVVTAFVLVAIVYLLLYKTRFGISLRALSSSIAAVELAGISSKRLALAAFCISGAFAGFVGGAEILVYHRKLVEGSIVGSGMGFTSIMVAWLGGLNPIGIVISSYYTAALYRLSFALQIGSAAIGDALAKSIIGTLFAATIVAEFVSKYKIVVR
ncbi:MAG: ABC transporter permease [Ignisphaera sp.]